MDYKQIMMNSAKHHNAQEKAYQEKIAEQKSYIHKMYKDVCEFVEYLIGENPKMEISKNEGGSESGNKVRVKNKYTCNGLLISTPHTYRYGEPQIQFWVYGNGWGKGYIADYDNYKECIADLMGHII